MSTWWVVEKTVIYRSDPVQADTEQEAEAKAVGYEPRRESTTARPMTQEEIDEEVGE